MCWSQPLSPRPIRESTWLFLFPLFGFSCNSFCLFRVSCYTFFHMTLDLLPVENTLCLKWWKFLVEILNDSYPICGMQHTFNQRACGLQNISSNWCYFTAAPPVMCSVQGNDIIKVLSLNNHFAVRYMGNTTCLILANSVWCSLKTGFPSKFALIKMGILMSLRWSASNGTFETIKTLN